MSKKTFILSDVRLDKNFKEIGRDTETAQISADAAQAIANSHASRHGADGADPIKLDDLSAPDDNTDLNVSTSTHGLCPKLPNDADKFLNGVGNWLDLSGLTKTFTLTPPEDITSDLTWDNTERTLDLTSKTSGNATWVILSVYFRRNGDFLTELEFYQYSDSAVLARITSDKIGSSNYHCGQVVEIPIDSEQRVKYKAPASASEKYVKILGYREVL